MRSRICPQRIVTDDSREWIAMRTHYLAGFLPFAGGSLEQPNGYLEAMALIDSWIQRDGN